MRVLSTAPAATAANGLPPASTTPTAAICDPPAKTSSDSATGTHQGSPPATEAAPNDTATIPSARQTSPTSRTRVVSRGGPGVVVRHRIRMFVIMHEVPTVRQTEHKEVWSEHLASNKRPGRPWRREHPRRRGGPWRRGDP